MNPSSFRLRATVVGALLAGLCGSADAIVVVQSSGAGSGSAGTSKRIERVVDQPVVLPDRGSVLFVDWVDTRNARLAIGGLTYVVRGSLPTIELANGSKVTDIGYLKKGTQVKIQFANDAKGVSRLSQVIVVAAVSSDAAPDSGASGGTSPAGNGGRIAQPAATGSVGRTR